MSTEEFDALAESAIERGDREALERLFMEACSRIGGTPDLPEATDAELLAILNAEVV